MNEFSDSLSNHFLKAQDHLPGSNLGWLKSFRSAGMDNFVAQGLPTKRWEEWKYTKFPDFSSLEFRNVEATDGQKMVGSTPNIFQPEELSARLIFVNGFLREDLSYLGDLSGDVIVQPMVDALRSNPEFVKEYLTRGFWSKKSPLVALNEAFMETGVIIRVRSNCQLVKPIEIVHLNGMSEQPLIRHPRNLIIVEEGAEATVIKNHSGIGVGEYFTNAVSDIVVKL